MPELLSIAQATQPINDGFPWIESISVLIGAFLAIIALLALNTWKKELRTRRRMQFLDEFNDSFYEFIEGICIANDYDYAIQHDLRALYAEVNGNTIDRNRVDWATEFLDGPAVGLAGHAQESLKKIEPAMTKMKALASKGHVLHLYDYKSFESDCEILIEYWRRSHYFTNAIILRHSGMYKFIKVFIFNSQLYKIMDMDEKDFVDLGPIRNEIVKRVKKYLAEQYGLLL